MQYWKVSCARYSHCGERGATVLLWDQKILTNLRFVDDLLLVASSEWQMKEMITDLVTHSRGFVLELHGNPHE